MSGRACYPREIIEWFYIGLIGIALAFTTLTGAVASNRPFEPSPPSGLGGWDVCLAHDDDVKSGEKQECNSGALATPTDWLSPVFSPSFVHTDLSPYTHPSVLTPPTKRHAY